MSKDKGESGEVDYRTKSGTAWSHNYLNQKPWHPLSFQNQRRKWIQEQTDAQKNKKLKEVQKEFEQEQDFLKTSAMLSKKDRERLEAMQAVSFMYTRPPGYNPESARAAEIADEKKSVNGPDDSSEVAELERRNRPKDVFGRTIATGEDFPELINAPKLDTGVAGRARPFGIELRNVRCLKCGKMGHQSGDRECQQKDEFTPAELARQKREDPLNMIIANSSEEPLKWELKQQSGMSPPRGGFRPSDPNQQILPPDLEEIDVGGTLEAPGAMENVFEKLKKLQKKEKERKLKKKQRKEEKLKKERDSRKRRKGEKKSGHSKNRGISEEPSSPSESEPDAVTKKPK